jgi:hypothetical protein
MWDFGVEDGSGKATVIESAVWVHEYGGGRLPVGVSALLISFWGFGIKGSVSEDEGKS